MKQEEGLKEQGPEGGGQEQSASRKWDFSFQEMVIDIALAKDLNKAIKKSNAKIAKGSMLTY